MRQTQGMSEPLKQTLQSDLTSAMKQRNEVVTATLRMALTAVTNEEVSGASARELSDDEVMVVIRRELKKRNEAAAAFEGAGRAESAQRERDEAAVLQHYLPAQLDDEALAQLAAQAVAETGASGPSDMGKVMKVAQQKVAGRADGGRVAAAVKAVLSQV